ncbi:MAG TPA: phosphonate ABC transporter, permease protein PhnE [Deinococcales bacterium]|nr:phosphonate ABC transporter, permease protein PhnE [Deinococcales bacterium]
MIATYVVLALIVAVGTLLARGSARRLVLAGAAGLVISFLSMPFAVALGAFTRHTVAPTALALAPVYPLLLLAPILAIAVFAIAHYGNLRLTALAGLALGAATLGTAAIWWTAGQPLVRLSGVPGVLEIVVPLIILAVTVGLASGMPRRQAAPTLAVGLAAAVLIAISLLSPAAANYFDALRGYYKVASGVTQEDRARVVSDWAEDLEFTNSERARSNNEWTAAATRIEEARARLERADASLKGLSGDARSFALNERQEAVKALGAAEDNRRALRAQRRDFGVTSDAAALEPLGPIETADDLPRGYSVGIESSDAGVRRVFPQRTGFSTQGSGSLTTYGFGIWLFSGLLALMGGAGLLVRREEAAERSDLVSGLILAGVVAVLAASFNGVGFELGRLYKGLPFIQDFLTRSWPPDFQGFLGETVKALTVTVQTALIGTVLAALLALPTSLLAARNLTERNPIGRLFYVVTRVIYNIDRGVDTLIVALIFVAAVGLGPFAGVMAMAIHSMADLGKLYSEAIENADKGPIEALESAGAPGTSVVRWAVLPQVLPLFVSYTLYRFEINFRVSIVLGLVGAGGIGFLVQSTMRVGEYGQAIVAILAIVIMVNLIDFLSAATRRRIIG